MQLAGLSLIVGAILKKYCSPKIYPFLIALMIIDSPLLWGSFQNHWLGAPLWGEGQNIIFPFFSWFTTKILPISIKKLLTFWSKNVTTLYLMQWILFGWSIFLFDANAWNGLIALSIGALVFFTSHQLTKIINRKKI